MIRRPPRPPLFPSPPLSGSVVRAVADCPVPVVSAVGHEQDTPLCDLAADVRVSTPTAAGKLVVPELTELFGRLDRARGAVADRKSTRLNSSHLVISYAVFCL